MARCSKCPTCDLVADKRKELRGSRNNKKLKRFETANQCEDPATSNKKRRITEAENLQSSGHGGEIRGEIAPVPSLSEMYIDAATRAARPDDLRDDPFSDNAAVDEYTDIVLRCDKLAKSSICPAVQIEYPSMMKKMRGLLDPKLRSEVDFTEAAKDCSNVFTSWRTISLGDREHSYRM